MVDGLIFVFVQVNMCVCMYVCTYVCMYVCMYVCTYVCIYTLKRVSAVHKFFRTFKDHLKILGPTRVTWSKFHTEHPQILGATVQNLVARATWRLSFVHSWGVHKHYSHTVLFVKWKLIFTAGRHIFMFIPCIRSIIIIIIIIITATNAHIISIKLSYNCSNMFWCPYTIFRELIGCMS
jgi:hypothetical protein